MLEQPGEGGSNCIVVPAQKGKEVAIREHAGEPDRMGKQPEEGGSSYMVPPCQKGEQVAIREQAGEPGGGFCKGASSSRPQLPIIRPVWRHNLEEVLERLRTLFLEHGGRVTIALDMEFASEAPTLKQPTTASEWYNNLCKLVSQGDVLQVGLAISVNSKYDEGVCVNELNLEFNVDSRPYNPATVEFLKKQQYEFDTHSTIGIPLQSLTPWLLDLLYDRNIRWVVFQGDYDVAFLLANMVGSTMPETLAKYMARYTCALPDLIDVRVLSRIAFDEDAQGLKWLGNTLGVKRIGKEHSSGSDALVTMACYFEIKNMIGNASVESSRGIIAGLFDAESIIRKSLPMGHANLRAVDVWMHNFETEATEIAQAANLCYRIIGVDICFSPALRQRQYHSDHDQCLQHTNNELATLHSYEISLCLMSYTGQLAGGKWWRFHVTQYPGGPLPPYVHVSSFTALLSSCGLIRNENAIWGTFRGAECIASICHMMQRSGMQGPIDTFQKYIRWRLDVFPSLQDIGLLVPMEKEMDLVGIARGLGLAIPQEQSRWTAVLCAKILVQMRENLYEFDSDTMIKAYADSFGRLLAKFCPYKNLHH
jgi:hypothetical protein